MMSKTKQTAGGGRKCPVFGTSQKMKAFRLLLLSVLLQITNSFHNKPTNIYVNGISSNAVVTLYGGGSIAITAVDSDFACILLTAKGDDWDGNAPECMRDTSATANKGIYCSVGDKYTYSEGLEPNFQPGSKEDYLRLLVQACGRLENCPTDHGNDCHSDVKVFQVHTPVIKNEHCVPNKPLMERLPLEEYGSNNINHFAKKKRKILLNLRVRLRGQKVYLGVQGHGEKRLFLNCRNALTG